MADTETSFAAGRSLREHDADPLRRGYAEKLEDPFDALVRWVRVQLGNDQRPEDLVTPLTILGLTNEQAENIIYAAAVISGAAGSVQTPTARQSASTPRDGWRSPIRWWREEVGTAAETVMGAMCGVAVAWLVAFLMSFTYGDTYKIFMVAGGLYGTVIGPILWRTNSSRLKGIRVSICGLHPGQVILWCAAGAVLEVLVLRTFHGSFSEVFAFLWIPNPPLTGWSLLPDEVANEAASLLRSLRPALALTALFLPVGVVAIPWVWFSARR